MKLPSQENEGQSDNILVVDDVECNKKILKYYLEEEGAVVTLNKEYYKSLVELSMDTSVLPYDMIIISPKISLTESVDNVGILDLINSKISIPTIVDLLINYI